MRTVDYRPRHHWDRQLCLPIGSVEDVIHGSKAWEQAQQGKIGVDDYWLAVGEQLSLGPNRLCDLRRDFFSADKLDEALTSLISDLRARRILVGLLSNNTLELLDVLKSRQLNNLFDGIIISAQIGIMKPHPKAYQAILETLDVVPRQALLIDDSHENIAGALALGMAAIHFDPVTDLPAAIAAWLDRKAFTST